MVDFDMVDEGYRHGSGGDMIVPVEALPSLPFLVKAPVVVEHGKSLMVCRCEVAAEFNLSLWNELDKMFFMFAEPRFSANPRGPHVFLGSIDVLSEVALDDFPFEFAQACIGGDSRSIIRFLDRFPREAAFWEAVGGELLEWDGESLALLVSHEISDEHIWILEKNVIDGPFKVTPREIAVVPGGAMFGVGRVVYTQAVSHCSTFNLRNVPVGFTLVFYEDIYDGMSGTGVCWPVGTVSLDVTGLTGLVVSPHEDGSLGLVLASSRLEPAIGLLLQYPDMQHGYDVNSKTPVVLVKDRASFLAASDLKRDFDLRDVSILRGVSVVDGRLDMLGDGCFADRAFPVRDSEREAKICEFLTSCGVAADGLADKVYWLDDISRAEVARAALLRGMGWKLAGEVVGNHRLPPRVVMDVLPETRTFTITEPELLQLFDLDGFPFPDECVFDILRSLAREDVAGLVIRLLLDDTIAARIVENPRMDYSRIPKARGAGVLLCGDFAARMEVPIEVVERWLGKKRATIFIPVEWASWETVPRPAALIGAACGGYVNFIKGLASSPRRRDGLLLQTLKI